MNQPDDLARDVVGEPRDPSSGPLNLARAETARWVIGRASDEGIAGNLTAAQAWLELAIELAPTNLGLWAFLAATRRALGDPREGEAWQRLSQASGDAADRARGVLDRVDVFLDARRLVTPEAAGGPGESAPGLIWLLGRKLHKDATPTRCLVRRMDAAATVAARFPGVPVLLSGGALGKRPRTEAAVMAGYLASKGVDAGRLRTEDCSQETLENLLFARPYMEGRPDVCLVSEEPHVSRAGAMLDQTGWAGAVTCVNAGKPVPLTATDRAATYRDCLRLAGSALYDQRAVDTQWAGAAE